MLIAYEPRSLRYFRGRKSQCFRSSFCLSYTRGIGTGTGRYSRPLIRASHLETRRNYDDRTRTYSLYIHRWAVDIIVYFIPLLFLDCYFDHAKHILGAYSFLFITSDFPCLGTISWNEANNAELDNLQRS